MRPRAILRSRRPCESAGHLSARRPRAWALGRQPAQGLRERCPRRRKGRSPCVPARVDLGRCSRPLGRRFCGPRPIRRARGSRARAWLADRGRLPLGSLGESPAQCVRHRPVLSRRERRYSRHSRSGPGRTESIVGTRPLLPCGLSSSARVTVEFRSITQRTASLWGGGLPGSGTPTRGAGLPLLAPAVSKLCPAGPGTADRSCGSEASRHSPGSSSEKDTCACPRATRKTVSPSASG